MKKSVKVILCLFEMEISQEHGLLKREKETEKKRENQSWEPPLLLPNTQLVLFCVHMTQSGQVWSAKA